MEAYWCRRWSCHGCGPLQVVGEDGAASGTGEGNGNERGELVSRCTSRWECCLPVYFGFVDMQVLGCELW
jgi:hypothetical protein